MSRKLFNLKNAAIVAVFALVAFIGFNSFKYQNGNRKQDPTQQWYQFNTSVSLNPTRAQALEPTNYIAVGQTAPCSAEDIFCGVLAEDNSGLPNLQSSKTANVEINAYFDAEGDYTSPYIVERD